MAIQEVVDWSIEIRGNVAHHPTGPDGERAVRISQSFREMEAAIARWVADATVTNLTVTGSVVIMNNLPTSDPLVAGQLWSNAGVLTVSAG